MRLIIAMMILLFLIIGLTPVMIKLQREQSKNYAEWKSHATKEEIEEDDKKRRAAALFYSYSPAFVISSP